MLLLTKVQEATQLQGVFDDIRADSRGDIYTASKMLGYTDIHTTEIYAEVVMEKKVDAINLTNGLYG